MSEYFSFDEAVDYIADEAEIGAELREGRYFAPGDWIEIDKPGDTLHGRRFKVPDYQETKERIPLLVEFRFNYNPEGTEKAITFLDANPKEFKSAPTPKG